MLHIHYKKIKYLKGGAEFGNIIQHFNQFATTNHYEQMFTIFSCSAQGPRWKAKQSCLFRVIISIRVKLKYQQSHIFNCECETQSVYSVYQGHNDNCNTGKQLCTDSWGHVYLIWAPAPDKLSACPWGVWVFNKDDNTFNFNFYLYMYAILFCETWPFLLFWGADVINTNLSLMAVLAFIHSILPLAIPVYPEGCRGNSDYPTWGWFRDRVHYGDMGNHSYSHAQF